MHSLVSLQTIAVSFHRLYHHLSADNRLLQQPSSQTLLKVTPGLIQVVYPLKDFVGFFVGLLFLDWVGLVRQAPSVVGVVPA